MTRFLVRAGHDVLCAGTAAEAANLLDTHDIQVAFVDVRLPDESGSIIIERAIARGVATVYGMVASPTVRIVSRVEQVGGAGIVEKPIDMERISALLEAQREPDSDARADESDVIQGEPAMDFEVWRERCAPGILGEDERLLHALHTVYSVADSECAVLITGESGTGKELVARSLHAGSRRAAGPFVALNCAAIPDTMIEAELFGHARGSFTGAHQSRMGRVAAASGGTLFLDEIGDMPLQAQAKLLRLLQEHTIIPVGSDTPVKVDLRVVAATNQDLEAMVQSGQFRLDLFYRLEVIPVDLPPLRERKQDIITLANHFLRDANLRNRRQVTGLDTSAERALEAHPFPGNVRELAQLMERAVLLKNSGVLTATDLRLRRAKRNHNHTGRPSVATQDRMDLRSAMEQFERQLIDQALERTGGNRTEAAALLGVNRTTLVEKIRKYSAS
jgi:DNA-binding NtrC family response regulator